MKLTLFGSDAAERARSAAIRGVLQLVASGRLAGSPGDFGLSLPHRVAVISAESADEAGLKAALGAGRWRFLLHRNGDVVADLGLKQIDGELRPRAAHFGSWAPGTAAAIAEAEGLTLAAPNASDSEYEPILIVVRGRGRAAIWFRLVDGGQEQMDGFAMFLPPAPRRQIAYRLLPISDYLRITAS